MAIGKRFVRRAGVPFLAATTALGAAGASKEYLHRKVAEVRLKKATAALEDELAIKRESRKRQAALSGTLFDPIFLRKLELEQLDRHFAVQIPSHTVNVRRHIELLAGKRRLSPREIRLIEIGDTLGRLHMTSGAPSLSLETGGAARRLLERLQVALRAKGYR